LRFLLLWSCKQRSVVVSASTVVLPLIPFIEFKTRCFSTNLDEIFLVKIWNKCTFFKQCVQSNETIIQTVLEVANFCTWNNNTSATWEKYGFGLAVDNLSTYHWYVCIYEKSKGPWNPRSAVVYNALSE
jgi:hypothetical protein